MKLRNQEVMKTPKSQNLLASKCQRNVRELGIYKLFLATKESKYIVFH